MSGEELAQSAGRFAEYGGAEWMRSSLVRISTENGGAYERGFVLNAAYAGTNQILAMAGFEKFKIKYELCEIILCNVNENYKLEDGRHRSTKMWYCCLYGIMILQHLNAWEMPFAEPFQDSMSSRIA